MHATRPTTETVTDDAQTDDCGCTALMACFDHYLSERGRPAMRRVNDDE